MTSRTSAARPQGKKPVVDKRGRVLSDKFVSNKFKKNDPRIWRGGRPSSFEKFRVALQKYMNEPTAETRTRLSDLIDEMSHARGERRALLEYAFGKVPDELALSGDVKISWAQFIKLDKIPDAKPDDKPSPDAK